MISSAAALQRFLPSRSHWMSNQINPDIKLIQSQRCCSLHFLTKLLPFEAPFESRRLSFSAVYILTQHQNPSPSPGIPIPPVEAQAEGWLVLPHLSSDVVPASQLVAETVARGVKHNAAHATQGLGGQELHLGIRVIRLHQASRMYLQGEVFFLCAAKDVGGGKTF